MYKRQATHSVWGVIRVTEVGLAYKLLSLLEGFFKSPEGYYTVQTLQLIAGGILHTYQLKTIHPQVGDAEICSGPLSPYLEA